MPETATRLPRSRSRSPRMPEWLAALDVYKPSFDATSADTLTDGAEAFAEMSPDDQAFHQAHLAFRQVQALGDVFAALLRMEARIAKLEDAGSAKELPTIKRAVVSIARGQNTLIKMVADGGLAAAMEGDDGDDEDSDGDDDDSDEDDSDGDDDLDGEEVADEVENEDHGNGGIETVVPEVLPAGPRRPASGLT